MTDIYPHREVRIIIDDQTGRTRVFIPVVNQPSPEPLIEFDPTVTRATVDAVVALVLSKLP